MAIVEEVNNMRRIWIIFLATVFVVGVAYAQEAQTADEEATGIQQVKIKGPFKETWVHPDLDMAQYTKLYPWKTVFQFREGGETKGAKTTAGTK